MGANCCGVKETGERQVTICRLLVVIEFSRFPFAFLCRDVSGETVIQCLTQLFCLFGMPGCVYSDRGSAFMSSELREFLLSRNVAASRRTPYQPEGTLSASVLIRLCGKQ